MLDDTSLFQALQVATLPPDAPLAMPRQVLERRPRWRLRWRRLVTRLAR